MLRRPRERVRADGHAGVDTGLYVLGLTAASSNSRAERSTAEVAVPLGPGVSRQKKRALRASLHFTFTYRPRDSSLVRFDYLGLLAAGPAVAPAIDCSSEFPPPTVGSQLSAGVSVGTGFGSGPVLVMMGGALPVPLKSTTPARS